MSEFVLTGSDVFGRYCLIEQKRFGVPNEKFIYKVVSSLRSNCWCEVPYKAASKEVRHDRLEDCVLAICCGIDETNVQRFRLADVELLPGQECDRDGLLALCDELDDEATRLLKINAIDKNSASRVMRTEHARSLMVTCSRIRRLCGEVRGGED